MENILLAMKDTIEAAYAANTANLASLKEKLKNRPDAPICTKCKPPWIATTLCASRRKLYEENNEKVDTIYSNNGRHRAWGLWAKAARELAVGGKDVRFTTEADVDKLAKIVVILKNEFGSAGLDLASFDLDDLDKKDIEKVNELLYDTLTHIVAANSPVYDFLLSTDSVSGRDGRRALLDLIDGCVPPGARQTFQEEHSQLRYPARVDPRPLIAKDQRLVRDNKSEDWTPTDTTRKAKILERIVPEFNAASCLYQGFDSLSPVLVQQQLMPVFTSAVAAGLQGSGRDCTSAAASVYGGVTTMGER
ncbi:hypothetical protein CYMTET_50754 [Cymbomonas tetramitiformis]|uniref:Uncharacterized protein n=1 Tax=Cymbomonas tetramitiformis TaxID=36881 RepID=A0AAE0BNR8_9CHLO|nr:hypothetical protein CYMTET_50754 [Cymbomonas tetramitiformis]